MVASALPTRLADGLGLGSCPTSSYCTWKIRPAARRFACRFGSPVSVSRLRSELGSYVFEYSPVRATVNTGAATPPAIRSCAIIRVLLENSKRFAPATCLLFVVARRRLLMSIRLPLLLLASLPLISQAQNKPPLPPDINPVTLSRLPPVTAEDLDEEGRRLLAARTNFTPGPGPTHITVYSPRERDLGIPSGEKSPVGPRFFQLAVLITAREIDQQYEWSSHEPAGLRQGLEQSVIDVVKYDRDV